MPNDNKPTPTAFVQTAMKRDEILALHRPGEPLDAGMAAAYRKAGIITLGRELRGLFPVLHQHFPGTLIAAAEMAMDCGERTKATVWLDPNLIIKLCQAEKELYELSFEQATREEEKHNG